MSANASMIERTPNWWEYSIY